MRDFTVERSEFDIVDHSATGGPKAEIAVRALTNIVLSAGDTAILGSMLVVRNRHRGQWRPGWLATCRAIRGGQANGFGKVYALPKRQGEYVKPEQYRFKWE